MSCRTPWWDIILCVKTGPSCHRPSITISKSWDIPYPKCQDRARQQHTSHSTRKLGQPHPRGFKTLNHHRAVYYCYYIGSSMIPFKLPSTLINLFNWDIISSEYESHFLIKVGSQFSLQTRIISNRPPSVVTILPRWPPLHQKVCCLKDKHAVSFSFFFPFLAEVSRVSFLHAYFGWKNQHAVFLFFFLPLFLGKISRRNYLHAHYGWKVPACTDCIHRY